MTRRASILAYSLVLVLGAPRPAVLGHCGGARRAACYPHHRGRTGLTVTALERAEIALLPLPRISLSGVSFTNRNGAISRTGSAPARPGRGFCRCSSAASISIGSISSRRNSMSPSRLAARALPTGSKGPLEALQQLGEQSRVVINGGSVFVRSEGAIRSILRDVNLVLDEARRSVAFVPGGRGQLARHAGGGHARLAHDRRTRGRTLLSVTAPLLKLQFEATRSSAPESITTGQLTLSTRSLPELLNWFGDARAWPRRWAQSR